ncbi:hypothetical protein PENANT_c030G07981 [Penicillium antarcticum]|uniref:Uncharacterized protein n=1 Tax=Penicillium antarcticum TaxID=416450 RepID=A0A1V6PWC5_9EURO|nr:hypothetical protein PENANT_c030G07981 [Penicillium antarcticum]
MAPVSHGKFSYNVDTFYVEASGNIYRRAIPAELRALFDASIPDSNQRPDHPAHWFEAQLLHYGLSPSKAKATAKMRLSDAIQDGALEVPLELVQMEKRLKREWKRQDEAARTLPSGLAHLPTPVTTSRTTTTKTATTTTVATSLPIPRKRARDIEDDEVGERPSVKQTARRVGFLQSNITQSTGPRPQKTQRPELPNRARRRQGSGNTVPQLQTARKDVVSSGSGKSAHITPLTANSHRQTVSTVEALLIAGGNSDLSGRIGQVGIQSSNPSSWDNNEMHDYDDSYDDEYFGDSSDPDDDQEILENYLSSDNLPCQDPFDDRYPSSSSNSMSARLSSGSYADPRGPPPIYNQLFESQPPQRRLGLLKGEYDVASNEPTGNLINGNEPQSQLSHRTSTLHPHTRMLQHPCLYQHIPQQVDEPTVPSSDDYTNIFRAAHGTEPLRFVSGLPFLAAISSS